MSYAWYKFNKAVMSLDEMRLDYRNWLASDHVYRLMRLTEEDLPGELRGEFELLQRDMDPIVRALEIGQDAQDVVIRMGDEHVKRVVERIVYMHDVIELSENMIFSPRDFSKPPTSAESSTPQAQRLIVE